MTKLKNGILFKRITLKTECYWCGNRFTKIYRACPFCGTADLDYFDRVHDLNKDNLNKGDIDLITTDKGGTVPERTPMYGEN